MGRLFVMAMVAASAWAAAAVEPVAAQSAGELETVRAGDRVRVRSAGYRGVFEVAELADPGLVVRRTDGAGTVDTIPLASIDRLETRREPWSRGRGAVRGMLWGAAGGAATGVVLGYADGDDHGGILSFTAEEKAFMFAVVLGSAGAAAGGIVGALMPGHRWETLVPAAAVGHGPLSGARVGVVPLSGGRLGVKVSRDL